MREFLVFQLYGAIASWGDIAVGEYRPSVDHPSKSAITGLIAAALGIKRENDDVHLQLNTEYGIAMCTRSSGELLRDYHTIQVPGGRRQYATRRDELLTDKRNLNTILSQRDYRTDAFYQIALWCRSDMSAYSLTELQERLQTPAFTFYLGRKSCPLSLPLHPLIFTCEKIKQAFEQYPLLWNLDQLCQKPSLVTYYWEQGTLKQAEVGMEQSMSYSRRDQVLSRKRWQYSYRTECYYAEAQGE